ncbi:hypothetical protein NPIL_241781 [Nephila pilipes]|uniref:Uncharacterized protein n=1 Tax=Nephila pilipes TaxID=299642 RepID=A0A8X6QEX0_NEPPI|nr:hypothetical protein NPIL_221901 [Nephila pilipes]GFU18328.1 hypothetical protein NPIL_241781 [Nephila pilipes]
MKNLLVSFVQSTLQRQEIQKTNLPLEKLSLRLGNKSELPFFTFSSKMTDSATHVTIYLFKRKHVNEFNADWNVWNGSPAKFESPSLGMKGIPPQSNFEDFYFSQEAQKYPRSTWNTAKWATL